MSVPVNQRSHGKLEACVKAHALCCYTLRITSNKKVFTPDFQEALTDNAASSAAAAAASAEAAQAAADSVETATLAEAKEYLEIN